MSIKLKAITMIAAISFSALTHLGSTALADSPVSSTNNAKATSILSLFNELSKRSSTDSGKAFSGQFAGYAIIPSTSTDSGRWDLGNLSTITSLSGETPALIGCDYYNGGDVSGASTFSYACNNDLQTHFNNGGLVSVSHHIPNPFNPSLGVNPSSSTTPYSYNDINTMLVGSNCTNCAKERWFNSLYSIYTGLKDLKDKGVVVLYRPLHEVTGDWFWWNGLTPSSYKGMWNSLYDYMTNPGTSGRVALDNLLWVYAPDYQKKFGTIYDPGANATVDRGYTNYYPGNNRVDVIALDAYVDNPDGSLGTSEYTYTTLLSAYNTLTTQYPSKPFAFGEMGPQTWGTAGALSGTFNFQRWMNALTTKFPKATYWMAWNNSGGPYSNPSQKFHPAWNDPTGGNTSDANYKNKKLYTDSYTLNLGTRKYNFENTTELWLKSNFTAGPWSVTDFSIAGAYSLKADVSGVTAGSYYKLYSSPTTWNVSSYSTIKAVVKYNYNSSSTINAQLYVKANDIYHYGPWLTLSPNTSSTIILPVNWISSPSSVTEIGVAFNVVNGSGSASFYVDNVMAQ